jgi:hypothetical protein
MSDLDLEAIRVRADAATAGPWGSLPDIVPGQPNWIIGRTADPNDGYYGTTDVLRIADENLDGNYLSDDDAEFIAHARTDIPALIAEVEALRAQHEAAPHGSWCNSWFREDCNCWKAGHSQVMLEGGPRYPSRPTTGEPE